MRDNKTFAVVGGDQRQAHLLSALAGRENGFNLYGMFLEKGPKLPHRIHQSDDVKLVFPQSDVLIFPLPLLGTDGGINTPLSDKRVSLAECLDYILPESAVFAGMVPDWAAEQAARKGIRLIDYFRREEFAVGNAGPTAEGAVEIALRELPFTLYGAQCLITGYGRIAKVLAKLLVAFGARVKVVARKPSDLVWAQIAGCTPVPLRELGFNLRDTDVLFNTVPAVILDEEKLAKLGRNCLVIDLATKPGGVDFETAKNLGLKTIWALSLPGKVSPDSAGEIILDTVLGILCEGGILS
jgi:dipicolinate synthase subunit A